MNQFGVNLWWTVPETAISADKVNAVLEAHGFEARDISKPSRRSEVSRAVYSFQQRRGNSDRRVAEMVKDTGQRVTYGILDQEQVDDESVAFAQQTTIRLNKVDGVVTAEGDLAEEVCEAVSHFTGKITDDDIRAFLRKLIRMCRGISKRPTGGIYFIPHQYESIIRGAQGLLDDLGCGARVYIENVVDDVEARQNVWESVERDISGDLDKALHAVERIEKSSRAVKGHALKLTALDEMMGVYRALLGEEAKYEDLAEKLSDATRLVEHKMSTLQAEAAAVQAEKPQPTGKRRGSKVMEAAVTVLSSSGDSMHYRVLTDAMISAGVYNGSGKSPADSVRKIVQLEIDRGDSRVESVARGVYRAVGNMVAELTTA